MPMRPQQETPPTRSEVCHIPTKKPSFHVTRAGRFIGAAGYMVRPILGQSGHSRMLVLAS